MISDLEPLPIVGYRWYHGSGIDEALVVRTLRRAYQDLGGQDGPHLADTVRRHLSSRSKLWWVVPEGPDDETDPIGCLWLSEAVDQRTGESQAYVFLVYVAPAHRRRGIGTALMGQAQRWASKNGYPSISLQVFEANRAALALYEKLGYESQAVWLTKALL
ncbi:MAG: GNAT family N-acetyltransferase [Cyanobacteria bacterium P01_A01_bin.105]